MELKRIGGGWLAWLSVIPLAALVAFVGDLIFVGDWAGVAPDNWYFVGMSGFMLLIGNSLFLILPLWFRPRQRSLATVMRGGATALAPASYQPDPALALRDSESLTLEYRRTARELGQIAVLPLLFGLMGILGEVVVFSLIPAFGRSSLNPLYIPILDPAPPPPPPTTLDWLAAAYPLALSALLLLVMVGATLVTLRTRISADDRGVTVRSGGRPRFIPWTDLRLCLRLYDHKNTDPASNYVLWGAAHVVEFGIPPLFSSQFTSGATMQETYTFPDGYDAFAANARRLLATISARAYTPIQTIATLNATIQKVKTRLPLYFLRADDIAAAPLAPADRQPDPQRVPASLLAVPLLTLRPRLPFWPVAWRIAAVILAIGGFAAFALMTFDHPLAYSPGPADTTFIWFGVAFITLIFALPIGVALGVSTNRESLPIIRATPQGLTRKTWDARTTVSIPWGSIQAWSVHDLPNGAREYAVASDISAIIWREDARMRLSGRIKGDRRLAFQDHAAQLHALIAMKTGLPLRQMP